MAGKKSLVQRCRRLTAPRWNAEQRTSWVGWQEVACAAMPPRRYDEEKFIGV
ncbi:MAG: hypothetical protein RMM98_07140 [Acidobacteriota bacterium]|nr:hypothetical protein [Acidobacteriota bacterium]